MKIRMLADKVLVELLGEAQPADALIVVPDTAKVLPRTARVLSVGPGAWRDGERVPMNIEAGDVVLVDARDSMLLLEAGAELVGADTKRAPQPGQRAVFSAESVHGVVVAT